MNDLNRKKYFCVGVFIVWGIAGVFAQTMEECVELALKNNLELQRQQLNPVLAQTEVSEQKSKNYGKLSVVGGYMHYNLPRTLAPLTPASILSDPLAVPTTEDLFNAGVVYELPLFTGFSQTRSVEISKLQQEMARAALRLNREQLIYNVKTLYANILALQEQVHAQDAYVVALQRLYDDISQELELGKKARIDLLKAAADLKNAVAKKQSLVNEMQIAKDSLANLLQVDQVKPVGDIHVVPEIEATIPSAFGGLQRLQVARLATEKSQKMVEKTSALHYPQIYFNAAYGQNFGPNDDSNKYSGDWNNQDVWQAGVVLKWDVFNFGNTKSKVRKAQIAEQQSRIEQEQIIQEFERSLREAVTRINTAVSDYQSAQEELLLTSEAEKIEQVRFEQGVSDTADLLQSSARNQLAKSRVIHAEYQYQIARFHLDYLLEKGESQ
jgi:outer membrane protein TolC